ncbi:hypothetical protein GCM10007875_11400 [Limnobacter litoralis]|uniref:Transposase InsH N-terminal domain-containing protein n=1 Tax=Limnobacter litoralis TaxID=481366 RepID=A0ABQ5YPK2_9BURK|nr:hypothetical protein GCM10007875_11400 [Limnobacter litoralis]
MKQRSFSQAEYSGKKRQTRRDRFLTEIERITPWKELIAELEPHYPKPTGPGRPPRGLETMLRMYIAQQCFGLSDEGIEDAIYDSMAIRNFVGIDLSVEEAPDATTLLKFRRLLEDKQLTKRVLDVIEPGHASELIGANPVEGMPVQFIGYKKSNPQSLKDSTEQAVKDLRQKGFNTDQITVLAFKGVTSSSIFAAYSDQIGQ